MFHVFNDVYIDLTSNFTTLRYDNITISKTWSGYHAFDPALKLVRVYATPEDFADAHLNGDQNNFWDYLFTQNPKTSRLVVYVEPDQYLMLQLQYWKSIFKKPTVQSLYYLHQLYVQDCWLQSQLDDPDATHNGQQGYRDLSLISLAAFKKLYKATPASPFVKNLSKAVISFEYLLADYFANPNSVYKSVVMSKVSTFAWKMWIAEISTLKSDMLNGIYDINILLPPDHQLDTSDPANLFAAIPGNKYLSWIVDPEVNQSNAKYIEMTYDKEIFNYLYSKFYKTWVKEGDRPGDDMSELLTLLYTHKYEELLDRDIARGMGCTYLAGKYRLRANQVFASWLYHISRSGTASTVLKPYALS